MERVIKGMEVDKEGRIFHAYERTIPDSEQASNVHNPYGALEINEKYSDFFYKIYNNLPVAHQVYRFTKGKFQRVPQKEVREAIFRHVDEEEEPTLTPGEAGFTKGGKPVSEAEFFARVPPAMARAFVDPVPREEDFPELPEDFVIQNFYGDKYD